MKKINVLETRLAARFKDSDPDREGNKNTLFADFIIDGQSLYQMLRKYDFVPALGWGCEEHQKVMIDYYLLKRQHDSLYYRYPALVCPWCADEECGFISLYIEFEDGLYVWRDFKLEPGAVPISIGPFYFEQDLYEKAIMSTQGMAGVQ